MVGGIAIIHSISCFMMIQKIMENEIEGSSYSIISLSFVAIWDMYLCIVNFLFAVRFEVNNQKLENIRKMKIFIIF